ncbi:MAG: hypothetical protein R2838_10465 [Caldilineaceae bacterium]
MANNMRATRSTTWTMTLVDVEQNDTELDAMHKRVSLRSAGARVDQWGESFYLRSTVCPSSPRAPTGFRPTPSPPA